jgi:ABC-type Fe3+-hydroxamate transport system substrate-binding protein
MRFLLTLLVSAVLAVAVSAQESSTATTRQCLTSVDTNTDYFPVKVTPTASEYWRVSYFKTYKIVTNIAANETYLLYQCGSEPPSDQDETTNVHSAVVEIPVVGIGVDQTPTIPFLEQLGLVSNIVAFTSLTEYISSPCLLESIAQGNVLSLLSSDEVDGKTTFATNITNSTLEKLANAVAFTGYSQEPAFATSVKISEYTETTNAAIFEWIKYYSVFFNLEEKANDIFALTQQRWTCVADQASLVQADRPKPVVLWAYFSDFCGGWAAGTCPNYYCEYATQCAATLVDSSNVEGNYSKDCGASFLSTDDIVALGKDADYWIYPGEDWNATYTLFSDKLDTMTVVQKRQVYDYQASGPNAWFEQRYPEYFAVLQDFCSIVGTVAGGPKKSWFRNVFTGPIGSVGTECTEQSRSNSIVPVAGSVCNDLQDKKPTSSTTKPTSNALTTVPFGLVSLMLSFVVAYMVALV